MATIRILSTAEGSPGDVAFTLAADEVSLGRELDNSIVLTDRAVSRHHAKIMKTTRGHLLLDSGSGNGIWMGKARVNNYFLTDGDVFRIGRTLLKFEEEPFDPLRAGAVRGSTDGIPVWDSSPKVSAAAAALESRSDSVSGVLAAAGPRVFLALLVALFLVAFVAAVLVVVVARRPPPPASPASSPIPASPTRKPTSPS